MKVSRTVVATTTRTRRLGAATVEASGTASEAGEKDITTLPSEPFRHALGGGRPPPPLPAADDDARARSEHPPKHVVEPPAHAEPNSCVDTCVSGERAVPVRDGRRLARIAGGSQERHDMWNQQEHADTRSVAEARRLGERAAGSRIGRGDDVQSL
jgi:hypothetical protein